MSTLPNDAPSPRLCIIVKWPDFEGYGFNLHAEKSKPGQYIGKVDEDSPAETAGLMEDDRIIEVNGVNIANENHKQVVQRIKAIPNETRLLVLDPSADKYYKNKNIVVRGTQENVVVRSSAREESAPPPTIPEPQTEGSESVSNGRHDEPDNRSVSSHASSSAASEASTQPQHASTVPEGDKDNNTVEEVTTTTTSPSHDHNTMETDNSSGGVTLTIKTEDDSGDVTVIKEGVESLNVDENVTEGDANDDDDLEAKESEEHAVDAVAEEEEVVGSEGTLDVVDSKEQDEVDCKDENDAVTPSSPEQESDLEAEYDNVEIDLGSQRESQTADDTRRQSVSSGKSNSSSHDGSDTPCTDTPTAQTPMSTSPTPPPSLDPEPLRSTASATTTTTTTTNNASPKPQPVPNKNTYNTSGLNLNMSAAEMRAMLARKKKADPRKETVDLKTKYEIIQNM